jgi:hypothetical protein
MANAFQDLSLELKKALCERPLNVVMGPTATANIAVAHAPVMVAWRIG